MPRIKRMKMTDDEVLEAPINAAYLRRLFRYLAPYKKSVVIAILWMFIASATSLASPLLMGDAVDAVNEGRYAVLKWYALAMVAFSTIAALSVRFKVLLMDIAGRKALATLREDLFNHIQNLGFDFFDNRSAGKIMVRVINDVNSLLDLFANGLVNALSNILTVFMVAGLMLFLDWRLALVSFSVLPLLFALIFILKPHISRTWRRVRHKISNMNGYLHECLSGVRVTQAYVREEENAAIYRETNADIHRSWMAAIRINNLFWPTFEIISMLGSILIYSFGVRWMQDPTMNLTVGTLLSMIWYLGRFWAPLNGLANLYNQILVAMASLERIYDIMDTPISVDSKPGAPEMPPIQGKVEFDHVTFGYDPQQVVLDDVSFVAEPGQTIALVGPTGAGKSTVINLVTRFYDVHSGAVKVDGHDVRDVELASLRRQMGIMLQDTFIFSGTIMDNIRYGRKDATEAEAIEAAKAVHAHDFILRMEDGYNTQVNERGSRLSVGQKQLIAFARALLADPKILILDEATAAIDTHTEILIQRALDVLLKNRTSFVIAHRLSTIRSADNIMVVDHGKIMEAGTHDELMAKKGEYYELTRAQYQFLEAL